MIPLKKLAEQARDLRLALTVRLDRSGKARDRLGIVKREFNLDEFENTRSCHIAPGERRANVYVRLLPEDSTMSGVKGMRKLDVENWVNTAALPDKIMGFREILRAAYALGVIDDFTYESQLRVKTLLDYNRRASWLMHGVWKVFCEEASRRALNEVREEAPAHND